MTDRPHRPPRPDGTTIGLVAVAGAYLAATAVVVPALRPPTHVDRVTVDNPHAWAVNVDVTDVTDTGRGAWLGVGTVEREEEKTFAAVLDQGDEWTFRFAYRGTEVELRVTGAQLAEDRWRVAVPRQLAEELRSAGVPETPP
jgi:hypothetical protein